MEELKRETWNVSEVLEIASRINCEEKRKRKRNTKLILNKFAKKDYRLKWQIVYIKNSPEVSHIPIKRPVNE